MSTDEMLQVILSKLEKTAAPEQSELIDTNMAAKILGVKPQTMSLWRTKGQGPSYVKVGTAVRYLRSGLTDYVAENTVTP